MSAYSKLAGTTLGSFFIDFISATAIKLKNAAGILQIRNKADTLFAKASVLAVELNDNGGTNRKTTIQMPVGAAADLTINLPTVVGSAGQAVTTDGAGTWGYTTITTVASVSADTTALAFGTASPLTLFTLPANAVITDIHIVVDTAFNGTALLSIGIAGTTSKYAGTGDIDLLTANSYDFSPDIVPVGTPEALIGTYSAGGATIGAARILVFYTVPS